MPSSKILHKRNSSPGAVPAAGSLLVGELALNTGDGTLFIKTTGNLVKQFSNDSTKPYLLNTSLSSVAPLYGNNQVTGVLSNVGNGIQNDITGAGSTIGNGEGNSLSADYGFIGNGVNNIQTEEADFGAILAGEDNLLQHPNSFILGSNITSHASGFTYIENLSCVGSIFGSNIEIGNPEVETTLSIGVSVVGINTESPNSALTVVGDISATGNLYSATTVAWNDCSTIVNASSAKWSSVYSSYSQTSGTYATRSYLHTNFIPSTGGNITGNVTAVKFYGDGSELTGIVAGDTQATTLVRANSSKWDGVYTTYSGTSSTYVNTTYVHTNFLPLTGGVLTGAITVVGNLSSTGTLYGDNIEIGTVAGGGAVTIFVGTTSVGINTETPLATLDVSGNNIRISETKTPASSGADGVQGEICWDSDYLYVCVAANTWKRAALETW